MRRTIADRTVFSALVVSAVAAAGCATTSLTTDRDERTQFDRYDSYAITPGPVVTDDAVTAVPDQLVQDRIDASLGKELTTKGLTPAPIATADVIVTYLATAREVQEIVDDDFGPEPWPFNADFWVQNYRDAVLSIMVLDAATQKPVWRVTARTKNEDFHDPEFVARIVSKAMKDFPESDWL